MRTFVAHIELVRANLTISTTIRASSIQLAYQEATRLCREQEGEAVVRGVTEV